MTEKINLAEIWFPAFFQEFFFLKYESKTVSLGASKVFASAIYFYGNVYGTVFQYLCVCFIFGNDHGVTM